MKEIIFLRKYEKKWRELEELLNQRGHKDPDRLSDLFIQLTDDLSYVRTYYPDSNVVHYLNQLSSQLHQEIYRNKKEDSGRFMRFWKYEVPLTIAQHSRELQLAFLVFFLSFGIGWLSASNDDTFVRLILGDGYVNSTLENIENGKPMDVYGQMGEGAMFLYITLNNIFVSFVFFALGITLGIGSLVQLVRTGIMVGAFLCFFYQQSFITDALLAIWMHGTIEIAVAVIAAAAGLTLGKSIAFPGTYSRLESIKRGAKDGLKMLIGLVPCFVIAGFIESFLTRHYNANPAISASVIVLSLAFIIFYFGVYPRYVYRQFQRSALSTDQAAEGTEDIVFGSIWASIGVFVSAATFDSRGGITILFIGPIVYGIVRIIRGIRRNAKNKKAVV